MELIKYTPLNDGDVLGIAEVKIELGFCDIHANYRFRLEPNGKGGLIEGPYPVPPPQVALINKGIVEFDEALELMNDYFRNYKPEEDFDGSIVEAIWERYPGAIPNFGKH